MAAFCVNISKIVLREGKKIEKRKKTEIKIKINFHALFAIEKLKEKRNVSDGGGTKTTFFAH